MIKKILKALKSKKQKQKSDEKEDIKSPSFSLGGDEEAQIILGKAEVGKTYPLFGYVSEIISEGSDTEDVVVRINNDNIILRMKKVGGERLDVMKDRAFESGIFIATVVEITEDNGIIADCQTVIYGRKQEMGSA